MAYTLQEVADALGDEAQVGAGAVVIFRNNKHILIAKTVPGVGFEVTPEGLEVLEGTTVQDDGSTVISAETKPAKKAKEVVVEAQDAEVVLSDLDAVLAGK